MIRLFLLGAARIESGDRADLRSVLAQPRRMALLAYLALRAARGGERRDTLLGLFWPDSDADHGRGALRNALHFLRRSLGADTLRSRGSEEVWLDSHLLWCDALEFNQRIAAGDRAGALRLYAGDLLEGFFISGAPEFEHWLDGERSRLRMRAIDAARALAADAEAEGEAGLAMDRLRRLLELAPTDETAVRRLMGLLVAMGDRGEALRVFIDLHARLADEYGLEPAEETRVLAEEIRKRIQGGAAQPPAGPAPPDPAAPPEPGPAAAAAGSTASSGVVLPAAAARTAKPPAFRRWRPAFAATAATGALALLTAAVLLARGAAHEPAASANLVAVLPFEYRGAPEHAYLSEGLADLLAANLDGAGELRSVDPRVLLTRLEPGEQPIEPAFARQKATQHGAGYFVLGSVTEASGQLRITAALYGPGALAGSRSRDTVVEGRLDDILALVDHLTVGLLEGRRQTALVRAALRTTDSIEALKLFLQGEAALRRADVRGAIDHYRRATEVDSTFALAHYRLSSAAYRRGVARPGESAARALRHAGRLPREDSMLVAAWYHHVLGSIAEAYRLYQGALWLRPSYVEADFQLGELLFHWGSSIGVSAAESREPFSRVLAGEPANVEAAFHLARLAARDGRAAEVDSLVAGMRGADPRGEWEVEMDALRAFLSPDREWQDRAVEVAARQPGRDVVILESAAAFTYNLGAVERAVGERLRLERPAAEHARLHLLLVHLQLARGRYRDAERSVTAGPALPAARRLEYRAMIAALPFLPHSPAELTGVRAALAAYPDLPVQAEGGPYAGRGIEYPHLLWPGMFRPRRLYLLGGLDVRLGDVAAAAAAADSLAEIYAGDPDAAFAAQYERLTRARAAAAAGRPSAGLNALGRVRAPPSRTFESLVDHGRVHERWLRAELLRETGNPGEALRWYATFPDPSARDLPYLAPSHLRRAEIHDAAGDRAEAAFHYRRFIDLWSGAEAALQPEVARARQRLSELSQR